MQEIATKLHMSIGTLRRWLHSDGFPTRDRRRRGADNVADQIPERRATRWRSSGRTRRGVHWFEAHDPAREQPKDSIAP